MLQSFAPPIALKGKLCGGRGEQSVCAAQPPGPSLLSLSSALFSFLFLSFLLVYKSGKKGDSSRRKGRFAGNFQEKRRFLLEERGFFREKRGFFQEERGFFREERAICREFPGGIPPAQRQPPRCREIERAECARGESRTVLCSLLLSFLFPFLSFPLSLSSRTNRVMSRTNRALSRTNPVSPP